MTESVSSRRRARERQQIRQRILDAARELFAAEGYDAVTMRRVAEAIEYTPPVIYQHFPDKATLIREIVVEDFRALAHAFQAVARIPDPVERLRKLADSYVEFGLAYPNHYRLMFMTPRPAGVDWAEQLVDPEAKGNPELDAYAFLRKCVDDVWSQGRFAEHLTDPELIAQALWSAVHGVVSLHIVTCDHPGVDWRDPRRTAAALCDAALGGMLKKG